MIESTQPRWPTPALPQRNKWWLSDPCRGGKGCAGQKGRVGDVDSTCKREANFGLLVISYLRITVKGLFGLIICYELLQVKITFSSQFPSFLTIIRNVLSLDLQISPTDLLKHALL